MKKTLTLAVLALTLAGSTVAMADGTGFYVGGDTGFGHATALDTGGSTGGFAGYAWNKNVSTEIGYEQYQGIKGAGGGHLHALKADMDLTQYINNARNLGIVEFAGINQSSLPGAGVGSGYDYGLGLRYNVSSNVETRLRAEEVRLGSNGGAVIDESNLAVGVAYHF